MLIIGLEEVGIYRVPGMQSAIDRLKNCFNKGKRNTYYRYY
jgi:hypothetical protein